MSSQKGANLALNSRFILIWAGVIILAGLVVGVSIATIEAFTQNPTQPSIPPKASSASVAEGSQATATPEAPTSAPTQVIATVTPPAVTENPTSTPAPAMACNWPPERVMIISVDAMRPDAVRDYTYAPYMLELVKRAAVTWDAQTISPSITLPGHLSMLSGYDSTTHQQIINQLWQTPEAKTDTVTIFQRAEQANLVTAVFSGKRHLEYILRAVELDKEYVNKKLQDPEMGSVVADYIRNNDFDLLFVNLANVDEIGHDYEWMSEQYLRAVGRADDAIQMMITALEEKGWLESTLVILNSDHGGTGISHGDSTIPTNKTIPWIIFGPCVRQGYEIEQDVLVLDTAVMALFGLGIEIPADLDGGLVCEVFGSPVAEGCLAAQPAP